MTINSCFDLDSEGLLFGLPAEQDLTSWRQAVLADTRLDAPRSCWEEAGLAWAEAVERHRALRKLAAADRLAATPVWVYGGQWEERLGTGVWSDGLHLWVAQSSLQALRQEDLMHPLSYYKGSSRMESFGPSWRKIRVHVPPPVSALARTLLEAAATPTLRHAWSELQALLAKFGEQAWLDTLPEGGWTQAQTYTFTRSKGSKVWNTATHAAWEGVCQASLDTPIDWTRLGWDKDPLTPYSPVWLRRLHGSMQHAMNVGRAHKSSVVPAAGSLPNIETTWLRTMELWMTLAHATPDLTWRAACSNASTHIITMFEVDKKGVLDRLPWWPSTWSRQAVEGGIYVREDGHPHMLWNRLSAAIRDGADPWSLTQGGEMPAMHVLLETWSELGDGPMRAWLARWSSPPQPAWWVDHPAWGLDLSSPAIRWLLEQGVSAQSGITLGETHDNTPLHLAGDWDAATVQDLIARGAKVNALNSSGRPAFWSVADVASLQHALAAGADVTLVTHSGQSVVGWEVERGLNEAERYATVELIGFLLQAGASLPATTATQPSPMRQACKYAIGGTHTFPEMRTPLMEMFHAHGADMAELDGQGRTLLHDMLHPMSSLSHADGPECRLFEEFLLRLMALGADPWHRDDQGQCAFDLALAHRTDSGKLDKLGHQAVNAFLQGDTNLEGDIATVHAAAGLLDDSAVQAVCYEWLVRVEQKALESVVVSPATITRRERI